MKPLRVITLLAVLAVLFAAAPAASAHRPVWGDDAKNGVMRIENLSTSFAFYRDLKTPAQVDVYTFEAKAGEHLHAGISIPALKGLEGYGVSLAVLGPGLPAIEHEALPETHPEGLGGLVYPTLPGESFFEPFTQTNYWGRQRVELDLPQAGTYYILVWNPAGMKGKYVMDTGSAEVFGPGDTLAFPVWWLKVHIFFGQGPYLAAAAAVLVAALAGGSVTILRRRKALARQAVLVEEA